jgi:hypothetical protein
LFNFFVYNIYRLLLIDIAGLAPQCSNIKKGININQQNQAAIHSHPGA